MSVKELAKLIWKYLKEDKKIVYWCFFLAIFSSAIFAFVPLVYGKLIDQAVDPNVDLLILGIILVLWLFFSLLAKWMDRFVQFKGSELGLKMYKSFVVDIYYHIIQLPFKFHKDKKSGEQINKISRAGSSLWNLVDSIVFSLLPSFLTVIIAIIIMFIKDWRMTLAVIFSLIFYIIITIIKTKPIVETQKEVNKKWEKAWGHIYDTSGNIASVKSHANEDYERTRIDKEIQKGVDKMNVHLARWKSLNAWQHTIQVFKLVLVFAVGIYLLSIDQITAGTMVAFVGYVNLVFDPFGRLANSYRQLQTSMTTIDRAIKLYDIETELYSKGNKIKNVR